MREIFTKYIIKNFIRIFSFSKNFSFLSVNICLTKNKDKKAQPFGRMKVKSMEMRFS
jgi:hypothetical protein